MMLFWTLAGSIVCERHAAALDDWLALIPMDKYDWERITGTAPTCATCLQAADAEDRNAVAGGLPMRP